MLDAGDRFGLVATFRQSFEQLATLVAPQLFEIDHPVGEPAHRHAEETRLESTDKLIFLDLINHTVADRLHAWLCGAATPISYAHSSDARRARIGRGLARTLGVARQKVGYHLKELEKHGLVELVEEKKIGNCVERIVRATGRAYLVSAEALGSLAGGAAEATDRFSAAYVVAVAARALTEVTRLRQAADEAKQRLATLTLETEIRFATAADRGAFAEELTPRDRPAHREVSRRNRRPRPGASHRFVRLPQTCRYRSTPTRTEVTSMNDKKTRDIELTVELDATPEEVFRAVTEGTEIAKWLAPEARSTAPAGGKKGSIWVSWGEGMSVEHEIEIYDSPKHVRHQSGKNSETKAPLYADWSIEARDGGKATLRLVHSGFSVGADWDDEFDSHKRGWTLMLQNLRQSFALHPNQPAVHLAFMASSEAKRATIWQGLLGKLGFSATPKAGDPVRFTTAKGEALTGVVDLVGDTRYLALVVREYGDALLRFTLEGQDGATYLFGYVIAYGDQRQRANELVAAGSSAMSA